MRNSLFCLILAGIIIGSYGCATMIRGTTETLYIESEPEGALAQLSTGQSCVTPCQIKLKRNQTVNIKFTKDGCEPTMITVVPTLAGAGVILGGLIDYGTGAVYNLTPNPVRVLLKCSEGENTLTKKNSGNKEVQKNQKEKDF